MRRVSLFAGRRRNRIPGYSIGSTSQFFVCPISINDPEGEKGTGFDSDGMKFCILKSRGLTLTVIKLFLASK